MLLFQSWGWDIEKTAPITNADVRICDGFALISLPLTEQIDQAYTFWNVRLYKAGRSMQLFGERELFRSTLHFAQLQLKRAHRGLIFRGGSDVIVQWRKHGPEFFD